MSDSRSVVVRLTAETSQYIAGMQRAARETEAAAARIGGSAAKQRQALETVGSAAGKVGLLAGAGLAAVVVTAANFDEAMSHVAATGDDARSSIDQLREAAIQAGQDTAFSATEAAGGIENLEKAGVSAKDILGGGLAGSLDLAAAGGLQVADAAEIAATALTQFKLQGQDVPHVADLLAAAAGKAQGDVSDLSMALKQSGLVASQMGLSIEETTGTLAAFASAGLLGSDAGTSFRTMLLRLANPTQQSAELMKQLGINAYDAHGQFVGIESLAGQLQTAFQGQSQATRDAAMATLFGSDAIRAANVLYAQGAAGIDEWTQKVNDQGYAAETAGIRMDNLKGDVEQLKGALETAFIGAGQGSQGQLRELTQDATKLVNVFNKAPEPIQSTAAALLGVTAATSGAFWVGSKVVQNISRTRDALDQLAATSPRVSAGFRGIATAGAALTTVVVTADVLQQAMDKLANTRIDSSDLNRDLVALADGRVTDNMNKIASAFEDIDDKWQRDANPLSWISSWDPSGYEAAAATIKNLDDALASMVESGRTQTAAKAFAGIAAQAAKVGVSLDDVRNRFPEYATALDNVTASTKNAGTAAEIFGIAIGRTQPQLAAATDQLKNQRAAADQTAESFLAFGDSLNASKVSLSDWITEQQDAANALRDFTNNAETAARRGLDEGLIKKLEASGTAGALRMKQLADGTVELIDRANRAFRAGQAAHNDYSKSVLGLKTPDLDVNDAGLRAKLTQAERRLHEYGLTKAQADLLIDDLASGKIKDVQDLVDRYGMSKKTATALLNDLASGRIRAVQSLLNDLHDKTVTITTVHLESYRSKQSGIPVPGQAVGGYITGPGTTTSDSIPARLSRGEYVIRASAVDEYGIGLFDALNARQLAAGGPADRDGFTLAAGGEVATLGPRTLPGLLEAS